MSSSYNNDRDTWRLNDQDLIFAWLNGRLKDDESALLQERLRESAEVRLVFLAECQLDAALREIASARQTRESPTASADSLPRTLDSIPHRAVSSVGWKKRWQRAAFAGTVAAILLVLLGWGAMALRDTTEKRSIATIESVQGIVAFQDSSGERFLVAEGETDIRAGMLLLDGESAAVQFRFRDGSLVSLVGPAEASLRANDAGRYIKLRSGSLTAEVQPQDRRCPLIIETSTALVEVLGTVLSLMAEADRTQVEVESGSVRLRRLADGSSVVVDSQQRYVATLSTDEMLHPVPRDLEPVNWQREFSKKPPEHWKGDWVPASRDRPGVMRSVPCVMGRKRQESPSLAPIIHHGVSVRPSDGNDLGQVTANSRLQFTLFLPESTQLQVMVGVRKSDGRFGGNFELLVPSEEGEELPSGLRRFNVPLKAFVPKLLKYPLPEDGDKPYWLLITTLTEDAGMELAEIAFLENEASL